MATFEWDETKRQKTLRERGLDFANAHEAFEDDYGFNAPDPRYDGDNRWILIGRLNEELVVIAYKEISENIYRIISMRRAEKQEQKKYEEEKLNGLPSVADPLHRFLDQLERDRELKEEIDSIKREAQKRRHDSS